MTDNVSPTIYCAVEHFFQDARFMLPLDCPIVPQFPTPAPPEFQAHIESVYVQNTSSDSSTNQVVAQNDDAPKHNLTAYEQSAGEAIVSIRQFATQFTQPYTVPASADATLRAVSYDPFHTFYQPAADVNTAQSDKLDYLLSPFAFQKGSRHVRVYFPATRSADKTYFAAAMDPIFTNVKRIEINNPDDTALPNLLCRRIIPAVRRLEGIADFHMPYYQPFHMVRNQPGNDVSLVDNHAQPNNLIFRLSTNESVMISRAAGDDFSAGYLCGLPPYIFAPSSLTKYPPIYI
jgi:hypothetical protein